MASPAPYVKISSDSRRQSQQIIRPRPQRDNAAYLAAYSIRDSAPAKEAEAMIRTPSQNQLRRAEKATWPPTDRPRMRLVSWRPLVKNSLRGFATVELPIGLKIADIPVLVGKNGPFATLPSKAQVDKDGQQKRDVNGKLAYIAILEWRDKDLSGRFSAAVVSLVKAAHPDALDGVGP